MKIKNNFFNKIFKEHFVLFIIAVICLLPLLILSLFNQPSADDFCYSMSGQNITYFENQVKLFTTINGRYTTSAILSIPIFLSFNFLIYKLMPILLIFFLILGLKFLASSLLVKFNKIDSNLLTAVCLSIYIVQMPSIAQGFYWLSSLVSYQLSCVFLLLFFAFVVKLLYHPTRMHLLFSICLVFLIIGTNEIAMLITDFLLGVIFLYSLFKTKTINYNILILLITAFFLSFFIITSQGNQVRGETLPNTHLFFYSIFKALNILKSYLIIWVPITFIFLLIFFNFMKERLDFKQSKVFDVPPILVLLVVFIVIFIGFFAGYWALGSLLPPRAINLIYFIFILSITYFMFVLMFYFRKKKLTFISFSPCVTWLLFCCLIMLISKTTNVKTAYSDLLRGKAYKYDLELKMRYQFIKSSVQDTVIVQELKYKPKTLFVEDINIDDQYWLNGCYNMFFNKRKITISHDE
nr:DUF6056 family protein [uncultured Flavobacterium sp.]